MWDIITLSRVKENEMNKGNEYLMNTKTGTVDTMKNWMSDNTKDGGDVDLSNDLVVVPWHNKTVIVSQDGSIGCI